MLNKVTLIGRVGKDPDLRATTAGTKVARFSVATYERWQDKTSGEWKERTEWHNVAAWRNLAELCERRISKGRLVYIEGSLRTETWEGDDGQRRHKTEIIASVIKPVDKKPDDDNHGSSSDSSSGSHGGGGGGGGGGGQSSGDSADAGSDDDFPF